MLFILPPLLRPPVSRGVLPDELNVQVIKDQLAELKADLAAGRLDQSAFAAAQRDLERELLDDVPSRPADAVGNIRRGRWLALVLVLLVPALAVPVYQRIGAQALIERLADGAATTTPGAQQTLEAMVEGLAARMQQEPDNAEGWALLGRSYAALNRAADAVAAYRQALRLTPDDPQVLSDFADVLVVAHNGEFTDEVGQLLDRALAADPHFPKALWLRGHWKYRQADYAGAITDWRLVMTELPPGDQNLATVQQQIAMAQARLGQSPDAVAPTAQATAERVPTGAVTSGSIQVRVALTPALAARAAPDDTVFIYARAVEGPRMPLAIVRKRVADLPIAVTLDDSQAMSPALVLSKFSAVTVGARVSKSGQAMPASGDLAGSVSPVGTDSAEVTVTIDQVMP
jgi:cytochrome c-type biogenesis protein CcmH